MNYHCITSQLGSVPIILQISALGKTRDKGGVEQQHAPSLERTIPFSECNGNTWGFQWASSHHVTMQRCKEHVFFRNSSSLKRPFFPQNQPGLESRFPMVSIHLVESPTSCDTAAVDWNAPCSLTDSLHMENT